MGVDDGFVLLLFDLPNSAISRSFFIFPDLETIVPSVPGGVFEFEGD
jgi:hypothetical protein